MLVDCHCILSNHRWIDGWTTNHWWIVTTAHCSATNTPISKLLMPCQFHLQHWEDAQEWGNLQSDIAAIIIFLQVASMMYLLTTWSTPVQAATHLNWGETSKCQVAWHFNDLLYQDIWDISGENLDVHPLSFHVRLNANDLDEPTYKEVSQCNAIKLGWWQDAIVDELWALHENHCFDVVNQAEAEGRQIVSSTWVFKCKGFPNGTLLKYKAHLCIWGDQMYEGLKCEGANRLLYTHLLLTDVPYESYWV